MNPIRTIRRLACVLAGTGWPLQAWLSPPPHYWPPLWIPCLA